MKQLYFGHAEMEIKNIKMLKNYYFLISILVILFCCEWCEAHSDESPYCGAELENMNTRNHFVSDTIEDPTGGFKLTIQPKSKSKLYDIPEKFSPEFTITLDSTKYKTIKGLLIYVEHENQTNYVDEDDYNLRIGHFVDIPDYYFRPKRCGVKSPVNSTLEHFNREDKPLPQKFTWALNNVFDYENDEFHGVVKALAVVSMKEWGVPNPIKFQPKKLMKELYPEEYNKYVIAHTPFLPRMKIHVQTFYGQNPLLFIILSVVGGVIVYTLVHFIIRRIKLFKKDKKFEEYHRLDTIKIPKIN